MGQTILLSCSAAIASKPTDLHVEKKKNLLHVKLPYLEKGKTSLYLLIFALFPSFPVSSYIFGS
jgi:hypothetical protein